MLGNHRGHLGSILIILTGKLENFISFRNFYSVKPYGYSESSRYSLTNHTAGQEGREEFYNCYRSGQRKICLDITPACSRDKSQMLSWQWLYLMNRFMNCIRHRAEEQRVTQGGK